MNLEPLHGSPGLCCPHGQATELLASELLSCSHICCRTVLGWCCWVACSLYKHSLTCPTSMLWRGRWLFDQMHPAYFAGQARGMSSARAVACGWASPGPEEIAVQFKKETSLIRMVLFLF